MVISDWVLVTPKQASALKGQVNLRQFTCPRRRCEESADSRRPVHPHRKRSITIDSPISRTARGARNALKPLPVNGRTRRMGTPEASLSFLVTTCMSPRMGYSLAASSPRKSVRLPLVFWSCTAVKPRHLLQMACRKRVSIRMGMSSSAFCRTFFGWATPRVTIRADNEPALAQLVLRAIAVLKSSGVENVTEEGSVPYDPQTNGAAENAVRLVKGMFKVLLLSLEREIRARIPLDHPIVPWLFRHGAFLRALEVRGQDGKTAYQRARGGRGPQRLLAFGELCRYKCRAQEGGIGGTRWRFSTGIWLGVEKKAGQFIVYDKSMGGIRHARTLVPMPKPQKFNLDAIREVAATPWSIHEPTVPEVIRVEGGVGHEDKPGRAPVVRRLYIRQSDLDGPEGFGYTKGAPSVRAYLTYGPMVENSTPHSAACRARIEAELSKTDKGQTAIGQSQRSLRQIVRPIRCKLAETRCSPGGDKHGAAAPSGLPRPPAAADAPPLLSEFVPFVPVELAPAASATGSASRAAPGEVTAAPESHSTSRAVRAEMAPLNSVPGLKSGVSHECVEEQYQVPVPVEESGNDMEMHDDE